MTTNPFREIAEGIVRMPLITGETVEADIKARLAADDEEAAETEDCPNCGGKGYTLSDPDEKLLVCPDCDGILRDWRKT